MDSSIILYVAGVVAAIGLASFVLFFVVPGWRTRSQMQVALSELRLIERERGTPFTDLDEMEARAFNPDSSPLLNHAWQEFRDTLHKQDATGPDAEDDFVTPVAAYRQTMPAEMYFTSEALVHVPMRTEFFKHFPGVLTACGIIGTFLGLIFGLSGFNTTGSIEAVNANVDDLVDSVQHAFWISFGFIFLSVVVTVVEKLSITKQTKRVQAICVAVDRMFDAGAGEEYLSRLVHASESAADRTGKLKDALVDQLQEMINQQVEATVGAIERGAQLQADAAAANADAVASRVAESIGDTLAPAMERVAGAMDAATADTSQQVGGVLERLLADFNAGMQDMFGDQIGELNQLMAQTSGTLDRTAARFEELVADMQRTSTGAVDSMTERIEHSMSSLTQRQTELDHGIRSLVADMQERASARDESSAAHLRDLVASLTSVVSGTSTALRDDARELTSTLSAQQQQVAAEAAATIEGLRQQVGELASGNQAMADVLKASITAIDSATGDTVHKLDASASSMLSAVDMLGATVRDVQTAVGGIAGVGNELSTASSALRSSLSAATDTASTFERAAAGAGQLVGETRELIMTIGRDTRVAAELVSGVEESAAKLREAHDQVDAYLAGVGDVLEASHSTFAEQMTGSIRHANETFHLELAAATNRLAGVARDLAEVAESLQDAAPVQ